MASGPKPHCSECSRRNLVCDSQRPGCKRCSDASLPCPGYNERWRTKLRWVEPGRVSSRTRKPKNKESTGIRQSELPYSKKKQNNAPSRRRPTELAPVPHFDLIDLAGQDPIALKSAIDFLHGVVKPKLVSMGELRGLPSAVYTVTPPVFQATLATPPYVRYGLINMALCHQKARIRDNEAQAAALLPTFFRYRGEMIRSLSNDISIETKRSDKMVFAGIFQLLIGEVAHGLSDGWRYHFEAAYKFILLQGSLRLMAEQPDTAILVIHFAYIAVIADSSSPSAEQILTPQDIGHIEFLIQLLSNDESSINTYPTFTFIQILRINHLRALGTKHRVPSEELTPQAYEILQGLNDFSVEAWAETRVACKEDNQLLGYIYKSAVSLYALSALGSLSILPSTNPIDEMAVQAEAQLLYHFLQQAISNNRLKMFLAWPLMVLGVEAVRPCNLGMRKSVRKWSETLYAFTGSYSMLHQRQVLEKFWTSGKTKWDDCFDRPYFFTPATTVDLTSMT
ncbi:fungal-specific transcription factor domain-containing protein [Penicillium angulare]|uniref:Fungal-specific transcription factor domain-containing protein n=1 Tax=Penicillium angulare TaxID=116970 RepID=A0A9W9KJT2_9EURO|nr:fungal-specific transcription factor domain-containing protein [Penicillium angulare]